MKKIDNTNIGYILNQVIEIRYTLNELEIENLSTADAIYKVRQYLDNISDFILDNRKENEQ